MVSYDCPVCRGNGTQIETVIRGTDVEQREVSCSECGGSGHLRA